MPPTRRVPLIVVGDGIANSGDIDDNSCSHAERLNCFGRFGSRLNEIRSQVAASTHPNLAATTCTNAPAASKGHPQ